MLVASGVTTTTLLFGLHSGVIAGGGLVAELAWLGVTVSSTVLASAMDGN